MLGLKINSILLLTALLLAACGPAAVIIPTALPAPTLTINPIPISLPSPSPTTAPTVTPQSGPPHPEVALWLANEADGNLLVIDPTDNSVAVMIPTGLKPDRVLAGEGYAWALDPSNSVLIQVDLQTYALVREIRFPQQQVNALAIGAGAVWLGVTERSAPQILHPKEEYFPTGGVLRIDPSNGKMTGYAKSAPITDLSVSTDAVWALARGQVDTPLLRIDPDTLQAQAIRLSGTSDWLLEDAFTVSVNGIWLYSQGFGKIYHAAPDGRLYKQITLGQHKPLGPAALLEAYGSLWLAAPWGRILRIDPSSGATTAEIEVDSQVIRLLENSGSIWAISPSSANAYRINPTNNTISASASLGSRVQPTPVQLPTAVRRATQPCEDGPLSRLAVGMRAIAPVQPGLPIRLHKETGKDSEITGYIQPGQRVEILEGPQCMDSWVWWLVKNQVNHASGWAAEGDASEYWLIPVQ